MAPETGHGLTAVTLRNSPGYDANHPHEVSGRRQLDTFAMSTREGGQRVLRPLRTGGQFEGGADRGNQGIRRVPLGEIGSSTGLAHRLGLRFLFVHREPDDTHMR